jgi:hypothetical protein
MAGRSSVREGSGDRRPSGKTPRIQRTSDAGGRALTLLQPGPASARFPPSHDPSRRGGRVVDRTALEMRHTRKGIVGSNPTLSAKIISFIL